MDRIAAARTRLDEAAAFAFRAKEAGPPCSECQFKTLLGMCGNPAYSEQKFEPSTGEYIARHWTPVADARSDNGLCGPEALLFQPNSYAKVVFNGLKRGGGDVIAAIAALCLGAGILAMLLGW